MLGEILGGDAGLAMGAAVSLLGCAGLEAWFVRRGPPWLQVLTMPLQTELPPLLRAPREAGRGRGIRWRPVGEGRLIFWSEGAPRGLHGVVALIPDRFGRVHLEVRWAPWWTAIVAVAWLAVLGAVQGEARITTPLAAMLGVLVLLAHARAAVVAAATLRQALVEAAEREEGR